LRNNVLVTLSDINYLDAAKQLFASAYFNASWQGEFLLLAHDVPASDLSWFIDRGIHIHNCTNADDKLKGKAKIWWSKLELVRPNMKQWKHILFLDSDIIIRSSLDELTQTKVFGAVRGIFHRSLKPRFKQPGPNDSDALAMKYKQLINIYDMNSPGFNGGVYSINSDIISDQTWDECEKLYRNYGELMAIFDESIFGLFFYRQWTQLPLRFNVYVHHYNFTNPNKALGSVLHFVSGQLPWSPTSPYYDEWKSNLERAKNMDCRIKPPEDRSVSRTKYAIEDLRLRKKFILFRYKKPILQWLQRTQRSKVRKVIMGFLDII
jgi:lipopolysaccharide biosynthesis glycosyltransferase